MGPIVKLSHFFLEFVFVEKNCAKHLKSCLFLSCLCANELANSFWYTHTDTRMRGVSCVYFISLQLKFIWIFFFHCASAGITIEDQYVKALKWSILDLDRFRIIIIVIILAQHVIDRTIYFAVYVCPLVVHMYIFTRSYLSLCCSFPPSPYFCFSHIWVYRIRALVLASARRRARALAHPSSHYQSNNQHFVCVLIIFIFVFDSIRSMLMIISSTHIDAIKCYGWWYLGSCLLKFNNKSSLLPPTPPQQQQ